MNTESAKEPIDTMDYAILEPCNVMGILPLFRRNDVEGEDLVEVKQWGKFKRIDDKEIQRPGFDGDVFVFSKTRFSKEFIDKAVETAKPLFPNRPVIYLRWDEEKKAYVENHPCLLIFGRLCFVLAPRVEDGDEPTSQAVRA